MSYRLVIQWNESLIVAYQADDEPLPQPLIAIVV